MSGDFWRKLRLPWGSRDDIEAEVDDELAFHLEMRARDLMAEGVDPDTARARAAEDFGDIGRTRARYATRRARTLRRGRVRLALEGLGQDLRFAIRSLRRRFALASMAVLVLALGIGAPTTVFTLVDTIFFERPDHVVEPHRLVRLFRSFGNGRGGGSLSHPDYRYYRDNASTLEGLAAYSGQAETVYRIGAGDPDQLSLMYVSDNYFDVLGMQPAEGRWFAPDENRTPGTHPVAVLAHGFWTQVFGADPSAIGRSIELNGFPFTVVGIAPDGYTGISPIDRAPDVWAPIAMAGALNRAGDQAWWSRHPDYRENWLDVIGRLAPATTFEAAEANLLALSGGLAYEGRNPEEGLWVRQQFLYRPSQADSMGSLSRMLLGAVVIVLLVAIANVGVLLLSRATTRYREIGIRTALGAGRGRLVRQILVESLVLGLAGGAAGIVLAFLFSSTAATLLPLPFEALFRPDGWVLAAAASISVLTAVLVGVPPALHAAGLDVRTVVQDDGSATRGGMGRLRGSLVVAQVSLSMVLVAGALLFARSFWTAQSEDLGFDDRGVLVVGTNLRPLDYDDETGPPLIRSALERLRSMPGVTRASLASRIPFGGDWSTDATLPGGEEGDPAMTLTIGLNAVSPDYFDVMGVDIVAGRPIDVRDVAGAQPVVVINEDLAGTLFPDGDAVGRVVPIGPGFLVVGIARDGTYYSLGEEQWSQAYLSIEQRYRPDVHFLVEADGDPAALAERVQAELRQVDGRLAFGRVTTLQSIVDEQVARYEVSAVLVGLFGVIALILSAAGLYGVVTFLVSRRTREIGVRMALGADRGAVAGQVLRAGLKLTAFGLVIGLLGAVLTRGLTESLLYGVAPNDPVPLVGASLALLAVTALAAAGPARQATRVDPIEAMRSE